MFGRLNDILTALQNGVQAINNINIRLTSAFSTTTNIANNTVLGNISGVAAPATPLSTTQLTSLVNQFSSALSGAVPTSPGGTATFLRADGNWSGVTSSGGGTVTAVTGSTSGGIITNPSTITSSGSISLRDIPTGRVLGFISTSVSSGTPTALSTDQLTTLINTFSSLSGAVPGVTASSNNFLRADATFAVPPTFSSTLGYSGYAPTSSGGTVNYLRADGTWAQPPTSSGANIDAGTRGQVAAYSSALSIGPMSNVYYANYYPGIYPTSTNDSATGIQNLINALPVTGGDIIFDGKYYIGTTISIGNGSNSTASSRNGVRLLGTGMPPIAVWNSNAPTTFYWTGDKVSPMVQILGPIYGWGIERILFDGGSSTAYIGVYNVSGNNGRIENTAYLNCFQPIYFTTRSTFAGAGGPSQTTVQHCDVVQNNIYLPAVDSAVGITLDGYIGYTQSDCTGCNFDDNYIYMGTGASTSVRTYGVIIRGADTCVFKNLDILMGSGATSNGCYGIIWDFRGGSSLYPGGGNYLPANNSIYGTFVSEVGLSSGTTNTQIAAFISSLTPSASICAIMHNWVDHPSLINHDTWATLTTSAVNTVVYVSTT